ncbi:dispanin subfamily A member 2b-like [Seriola aureovittata]|uniref:dispanin subfamily A member 2b-like n=1 Tax=Seriola aureovittata TaxID=2871759 RepID=UPI0024BDBA54|nr:dispanin subfamily A member 2b-like [Seriola aureovittata]
MDPERQQVEAFPLKEHDGPPGGPALVQYTTINISSEPPRDHIIWSLLSFLFAPPCCLGLAAVIYSIKARDRKVVGDMDGARRYGSTARGINVAATVLFCILLISVVVLCFLQPYTAGVILGAFSRKLI